MTLGFRDFQFMFWFFSGYWSWTRDFHKSRVLTPLRNKYTQFGPQNRNLTAFFCIQECPQSSSLCAGSFSPKSVGPTRVWPLEGRDTLVGQGSPIRSADLIVHRVGYVGPLSCRPRHCFIDGNWKFSFWFGYLHGYKAWSSPNHHRTIIHVQEYNSQDFSVSIMRFPSPRA